MKKNKKLLSLIALLLGILALAVFAVNLIENKGNSDTEWINFAIEDTTRISKIIIEDTYGQHMELIQDGSQWHDENGDCVSKPNVSFILEAAKLIEFKGYLPEKSKAKFTELMATQHIKVSYFIDGRWTKSWYIGPPAQDHYGQIMLLETADEGKSKDPVMMRIKGLNGIISPRFFAERKRWMCTEIFALNTEDITAVDLKNIENPALSFNIKNLGRRFEVRSHGKKLKVLDTANVYRYLQGFKKIHFNFPNIELSKKQVDSVKRSPLFSQLKVTERGGKQTILRMHRIKSEVPQRNEVGEMVEMDMNLFWAELPNGELVKCQYFVFNALLMGHIYFPDIANTK
jgi:hypothetical protein